MAVDPNEVVNHDHFPAMILEQPLVEVEVGIEMAIVVVVVVVAAVRDLTLLTVEVEVEAILLGHQYLLDLSHDHHTNKELEAKAKLTIGADVKIVEVEEVLLVVFPVDHHPIPLIPQIVLPLVKVDLIPILQMIPKRKITEKVANVIAIRTIKNQKKNNEQKIVVIVLFLFRGPIVHLHHLTHLLIATTNQPQIN